MRAVVQYEYGDPEVLTTVDVAIPEPIPTEVQVEIRCVGVNPVDGKTREGRSVAGLLGGFPFTLGWDIAGIVTKLGAGVNRFAVGDRVYGMPRFPRAANGYAQYTTAPAHQLVRIPDCLDFASAAAVPLPATTAYQIVHEAARIEPGRTVLVLGAGGIVGTHVVQLAQAAGATVIGHATGARLEHLRRLGVSRTIDYAVHEFDAADLPGGPLRDVDAVVDLIGGAFAVRAVSLVARGGIVVGVPSGQQAELGPAADAAGVRWTDIIVEPDRLALEEVSRLIAEGTLIVAPPQVRPLSEVVAVHRQLAAGHLPKTVLSVSD